MGSKDRYKENRARVFEIQGIDPLDRRYNCHHIIEKSDYKTRKQREFWDASVPTARFDINAKGNLFPLKIEVHADLHRRLDELPSAIIRRKPEKKKKKKRKRKSRSQKHRRR